MTRSYFTYKQMVVRAVIEMRLEDEGGRSRSFDTRTVNKKLKDLAEAEGVQLGAYWKRYVSKAVAELKEANIFRVGNKRASVAFSFAGLRRLASSHERYGPLDKLSPFKKSQFLKAVAGPSRAAISSEFTAQLSQKIKSQENIIASLSASLAESKNANKELSFELEEAQMERDDLQLALLELERPSTPSSQFGNPIVRFSDSFDPLSTSTPHVSRPEPTIPSDRDSSPAPSPAPGFPSSSRPLPINPRPTTSFTHRPSGSFLNTISNQFTPSPSPGPIPPDSTAASAGSVNLFHNGDDDDESDSFDFGDVEMDDMADGFEGDTIVGKQMGSEASRGKQTEQDVSSEMIVGAESGHNLSTEDAQHLETIQQLVAANQERDTLTQKLVSVTQERDSLQCENADLRATLKSYEEQIISLKNELAASVRTCDLLQAQKDAYEKARIVTSAETLRVSGEMEARTLEVIRLTDQVEQLSVELALSNTQRDGTQVNLTRAIAQLEEQEMLLQTTAAELAATNAQLSGVQGDLRFVWGELGSSRKQYDVTNAQLMFAETQLRDSRSELDTTKSRFDIMSAQLDATSNQLQVANTELDATVNRTKGQLRRLQDEMTCAGELERTLRAEIGEMKDQLSASKADMAQVMQQYAASDRDLKAQLEDAHDQIMILQENLQKVRTAWTKKAEALRAAEAVDAEVQQSLFAQNAPRRDPSFRDSGVSISI